MSTYIHKQHDTPSDTWTVYHNLGRKFVVFDVIIYIDGLMQTVIPKAVDLVDENSLIVRFSSPHVGEAKVSI